MNYENKQILKKRLKSLSWRAGMMIMAVIVDFLMVNIGLFDLPIALTGVLGLILGECSKYLNTKKFAE